MPFMFEVGNSYQTQCGDWVEVLGRTLSEGYECLECSDGKYRYDRSTGSADAGRCTGTAHDYSDPYNFKRDDRPYSPPEWSSTVMQAALDLEAALGNAKLYRDRDQVRVMIKEHRGDNAPRCHGQDDCSTMCLITCPWRIDCGDD